MSIFFVNVLVLKWVVLSNVYVCFRFAAVLVVCAVRWVVVLVLVWSARRLLMVVVV